ncbi:MAG TPA: hypothetical protein VFQ35_10155 [Polyangiaceae bacterium]|nr:hypothetical protein [Polyangiaceae bacterium]
MSPPRLASVALLLVCTGCTRLHKTRECKDFAKLVNRRLDTIEASLAVKSAVNYRASSLTYAELSKEVRAAAKPLHPELAAEEFAQVFDSAAHATKNYALALDSKDTQQQSELQRELERLARQEHSLVLRVNSHCENP